MTPAGRPARFHWLAHFLQAQGHPHQLHFAGTREMTTPVTATVEGGTALCGTTSSSLLYILPSAFVFFSPHAKRSYRLDGATLSCRRLTFCRVTLGREHGTNNCNPPWWSSGLALSQRSSDRIPTLSAAFHWRLNVISSCMWIKVHVKEPQVIETSEALHFGVCHKKYGIFDCKAPTIIGFPFLMCL